MLSCVIALCAVNKTLLQAQTLYEKASTVTEYQAALKKFKSAYSDPNYDAAEHKAAIDKGVRDCEAKIDLLSASLTVSPKSISFDSEGGYYTLSVSTNQGTPSVTTDAEWLTVDSRSSSSITLSCSPNNSNYSRSATVTVTAGSKTAHVAASQEGAALVFTDVVFGSIDYDGNVMVNYGSPLYSDKVYFVSPYISYSSDTDQTKTVYYKWFNIDGTMKRNDSSPEGYTSYSKDVAFKKGDNKYYAAGWGWNSPGNYVPGKYKFEAWIDGKCLCSASFEIKTELAFTGVEFGGIDYDGNVEVPYGSPLYRDQVRYVSPRFTYVADQEQAKTVYYKWYRPNGTLMSNNNSPEGFTSKQDVTFRKGTNKYYATGRGWDNPGNYSPGTYRHEVWIDGKRVYSATFEIVDNQAISITDIEFGSCDYENNMEVQFGDRLYDYDVRYLKARISYTSSSDQTKKVNYRIIRPDGTMIHSSNSPEGCTFDETVNFYQGSYKYNAAGWGNNNTGYYTPGIYRYEVWIDGKRVYSRNFEIF